MTILSNAAVLRAVASEIATASVSVESAIRTTADLLHVAEETVGGLVEAACKAVARTMIDAGTSGGSPSVDAAVRSVADNLDVPEAVLATLASASALQAA